MGKPTKTTKLNQQAKAIQNKSANRASKSKYKDAATNRKLKQQTVKTVNRTITKGGAVAAATISQREKNKRDVEMARIDASRDAYKLANANAPVSGDAVSETPNAPTQTNPFGW